MEVKQQLSDSDKEFIRGYVAEAELEDEKRQRRRECADHFGVSLPTISAITAWTTIRANKTTLISDPIEIVETQEISITQIVESQEGCHVNYDNPAKQAWREQWKQFLASHTMPAERANMKVLCLPGKKCLEIPLYLELGFKSENITGVEGGDEFAKMEFHQNAYRYGINAKLGRLENLLQHEENVYDVISLDFTGPISKTSLDIVKMLPLAPSSKGQSNKKSYFMINLLAKREQANSQACVDFYASFTRPELCKMLENPGMNLDQFATVYGYVNDLADKASNGEKIYEEASLKDKRNAGLTFLLSSLVAKDRRFYDSIWASYRINEIPLEKRQTVDFKGCGATAMTVLLNGLNFYVHKKLLEVLAIAMPQIIDTVSNYRPFVYDVEQYQYSSPVNNANSPFITEMFELMTPMADYVKIRYVVRFFVDIVLWQVVNDKPFAIEVRDKHGRQCFPSGKLNPKDTISFITEEGFVISSITWQKIQDAWLVFMSHIDKDKTVSLIDKSRKFDLSEASKVTI